jgi:helix-turn-helix protein
LLDHKIFELLRHDTEAVMATKADVSGPINLGSPEEFSIFELAEHY